MPDKRQVEILVCTCRSFEFAHNPERHNELLADYDWRTWQERKNQRIHWRV